MNPIEHFESGLSSSQVSHSYLLNRKNALRLYRVFIYYDYAFNSAVKLSNWSTKCPT